MGGTEYDVQFFWGGTGETLVRKEINWVKKLSKG